MPQAHARVSGKGGGGLGLLPKAWRTPQVRRGGPGRAGHLVIQLPSPTPPHPPHTSSLSIRAPGGFMVYVGITTKYVFAVSWGRSI